ncbi:hypothetical protein [Intrasporangium sp.]|uniref:hypothetical protein n=1 Tax=Intrasporangium sp. TaxID=1925024 RepID=UPI00293A2444|nr:hypothetical protein [Intrasporangium sp.]MDV3222149.1 hypothetical protein [Intrasporangium sp.]
MTTSTSTRPATAPVRRGPRTGFLWLLRILLVPYAALLVAQPLLAGRFLEGSFESLKPHGDIGSMLIPLTWVVLVAAVLAWRPGRLGAFPLAVTALLSVLVVIQVVAGYSRTLGVHLPLGVGIVATGLALLGWAWSPRRTRGAA